MCASVAPHSGRLPADTGQSECVMQRKSGEVGSGSYVISWFLGPGGTQFVGRSTQGRVHIVGSGMSVPRGAGFIRRCRVATLVPLPGE